MSEIDVVAIVTVKPEDATQTATLMQACVAPSRAEAANHAYTPYRDLDSSGTFVFIERWASREALQAHMETPHFKEMAARLTPLLQKPLAIHILQAL